MSLRLGEYGKIIRLNAKLNLSNNTDLKLYFTKPDGSVLTKASIDGVTAPPVDYEDPTLGTFLASEYFEYEFASGDIDQVGQWSVYGEYIENPDKLFCGDPATFTVLPCGG